MLPQFDFFFLESISLHTISIFRGTSADPPDTELKRPGLHVLQAVCPCCDWYVPAAHLAHVLSADTVEYLPALHLLQELAPAMLPVFVIEPAMHSVHDSSDDAVEYLPASHAVHVVAPAAGPVFVIEPAWQPLQYD